ncbi:DNA excision repair protein ERCC-6-like [Mastomys coucha]|uniref:DNA excision repair protein ERCC-6-like n=1 Tax=Mastomys coucha TaxID=35658 RepID=UPI001261B639|nr:DNA excision repair protein ERCC-6-like [Mastomys coucha]
MEASQGLAEVETLSPQLAQSYLRYVQEAKEAAKSGDLEESLKLFNLAKDIFPTKKVLSRIQKLQEALEQLAEEDDDDDEFTDVCNSGLLLYRELYEKLFEYQKEGIAFLYSLYKDGRKGGILADDMGLGKTVQIIAFLSGMFDASLVNHVLLIMPTNLINTWVKEFAKWTPGMRVKTFHGSSKNERTRSLTRIQQRNGVVITTYQMLLNNWQQLASFNGQAFVWDYVILDEAHKIKSASTKSAICARAIPAHNRVLLTGTPIQNNLQELWSLFDFACQGSLLGTLKTFKMEYENPIIRAREKDATPGEKALGLKISENLMEIIKPYFLRRTKEEVQMKKADNPEARLAEKSTAVEATCEMLSLTRKNDLIVWIRLVPLQEDIYRKFVSLDHIKELLMETRSPLAELGVLKKLCDHPRLLSARACHLLNLGTATFSAQDENEQDVSNMDSIDHLTDNTLMQESGKMIFLMSLLERLQDEGHQTLVFSQSRQILNIIERLLKNKHFKTLRIDGTVTHLWEREKRIQLFQQNKEYSVFLLTTQVGGVGLTLTAATRVVIFDPSWNPATDAQAVDRVYRIGQKENVVVYRLITCGTVEEKIYRRQVFKDSLIRQTTGDKKNPFRYFTKQELKELFTVGDLQNSATQMQLQSLHAAQRRSDEKLDEHIAYLHSLGIAGISDHDLMFTHDLSVKEELDMLEDSQYVHQRVQKAQFLVESESQNTVERQRTGIEETWLKAQEFPAQQKKKGTELNKPQPQPWRLLTNPTQVEAISSQMASVSIYDQSAESEPQEHSEAHDVTWLQGDQHHFESPSDAGTVASLPQGAESIGDVCTDSFLSPAKGFTAENEAVQKKGLQASPGQEASSKNLGSSHYLPRQSSKADLGPNLDLQESVVLYHRSPTANENQNLESDIPMIEISDDLSASPSALQGAQAIEAQLELKEDPLESPPQYACDFNLFLEESADTRQNLSSKFLEHVEKERSLQSPAANSEAESALNLSLDSSNKSGEESEVVTVKTQNKARRILSDDEDEEDALKGSFTHSFNISPFPFSSVKQFDASTPQNEGSPSRRFFSPKIPDDVNTSLHSRRRSLASRRSLINVVLGDVEDMEERLANSSEEESEPGLSEESSEEAVAGTEEQPSGATLASENKSSNLPMSEPTFPAPQSSPCAPEPLPSDPLLDPAVEAANDYETLVARGKELKECGKIQEALNCLVKALDIKSADPEVMLMTLSLYKQLNI